MLRSHGMVRELDSDSRKKEYADEYSDLNPDFLFAHAGYNVRSTEINAVIGRSQLRRLDEGVRRRTENLLALPAPISTRPPTAPISPWKAAATTP